MKSVETLAAQEKCQCWNVPDSDGDTPVFKALKEDKMDILQILLKCPRVDLKIRDRNNCSLEKNVRFVFLLLIKFFMSQIHISETECWKEKKNIKTS